MLQFINDWSMPTLDLAMPIALLLLVTVAVFLNKHAEHRLKSSVEEKEFQTRDIVMLVAVMAIVISVIAVASFLNPGQTFQNVLLAIFLGSYTMLLFTFSFIFSALKKRRAQFISAGFGAASLIAGAASLLGPLSDAATIFRAGSFFALAVFCFAIMVYEQKKSELNQKEKWYIAVQPPAIFLLLFVFFNLVYGGAAQVWYPFLMDAFGITFALLIILYLSPLFSWKTVGLFAVLLTIMDIILVIGTGTMVEAANTFSGLGLPVLVYLPNVPLYPAAPGHLDFLGFAPRGLGLGDFFFAGILAVQTAKKLGQKTGLLSVIGMTVTFGIWEAFLPDILKVLNQVVGRDIGGFPGTLMIICGWAIIVGSYFLIQKLRPKPPATATFRLEDSQPDSQPI